MKITEAIQSAWDTLSGTKKDEEKVETEEGVVKPEGEEKKDPPKDEKPKEEAKPAFEMDERTKKAIQLYNVLEDPDTAPDALQLIINKAKKAGYLSDDLTPKERKEVAKDLLEEMRDAVPEEGRELVELMYPAFKAMVDKIVAGEEIKRSDLEKKLAKFTQASEQDAYVNKVQTILSKDKYQPYLTEMVELSKKMAPQDGVSEEEYFELLHDILVAKHGKREVTKKQQKKAEENKEEQMPSSTGKGTDILVLNRKPTLSEAIAAAQEGKQIKYTG